jgi:hypothetical protein
MLGPTILIRENLSDPSDPRRKRAGVFYLKKKGRDNIPPYN